MKPWVGLRHRLLYNYEEINFSKVYDITQQPISQRVTVLESLLRANEGRDDE